MCRRKLVEDGDRSLTIRAGSVQYHSLPPKSSYADNNVITSQYTWWNFIPKNLSEQFSNLANLYFLLVGIFQIIPQISTTNGIPTMYQPLAFIVLVSAARAISEDYGKHTADSKRNSYLYDVLSPAGDSWLKVKSGDLSVGNIVRVHQNEMIPTDMIFLGSSLPQGHCFIDKANLNGETKLEVYSSLRETRAYCPPLTDDQLGDSDAKTAAIAGPPPAPCAELDFDLVYEPPNKRFDSFRGTMTLRTRVGDVADLHVDGKALLMRETNLKNTDFIYGAVVYSGNDTKIQRSNLEGEKARVKVSSIMRQVNVYLRFMLLAQALCCLAGAIAAGVWAYKHGDDTYMRYTDGVSKGDATVIGVLAFFSWFINLSQMVPISLIVSGEMVKFIMSRFINWDISLYHSPIAKAAHCNSSTIHEDLGLVDYVFSDKTGTLTQNKMEFRYALLASGADFGSRETEIAKAVAQRARELKQRQQGTFKPAPMPRWTELVAPHLPARSENRETGYDIDCCRLKCPRWCWWTWINPKMLPFEDDIDGDEHADDDDNNDDAGAAYDGHYSRRRGAAPSSSGRSQPAAPATPPMSAPVPAAAAGGSSSASQTDGLPLSLAAGSLLAPPTPAGAGMTREDSQASANASPVTPILGGNGDVGSPLEHSSSSAAAGIPPSASAGDAAAAGVDGTGASGAASGSEANTFTSSERAALLRALYGPCPPGVSAEAHEAARAHLELYMMHMALSNTVKPFVKDGRLDFQPESAEELAMVQFAHRCGFTKLPEKEEKEKTPEEKASNANTRVSIQRYDANLVPAGPPEERRFAFLACFGFTSQRARVTVVYQDERTREILVMIKGQDGMVLPLLTLPGDGKYEETLLGNLKDLSSNGLRTLIAGHAVKPESWWAEKWGKEYRAIKEMPEADDEARRKVEHDLFEKIEVDAAFDYLGCLGMEDQLQPLVPDCIQACLRAGIKVWMITGDKLETARNIGLACNLIDADMQPQIHAGDDLPTAMSAFSDSRLVQVTGEWHSMFDNQDELGTLFDSIDYNHDGLVTVEELTVLLRSLSSGISEETVRNATQLLIDTEAATEAAEAAEAAAAAAAEGKSGNAHSHGYSSHGHYDQHVSVAPPGSSAATSPATTTFDNNSNFTPSAPLPPPPLPPAPMSPGDYDDDEEEEEEVRGGVGSRAAAQVPARPPPTPSAAADGNNGVASLESFSAAASPPYSHQQQQRQQPRPSLRPVLSVAYGPSSTPSSLAASSTPGSAGSDGHKRGLTREGFLQVMKSFKRTPFDAVSHDVDEGLKRYLRIQDHAAFPISLLVNRDAFLVMFPGKRARRRRRRRGTAAVGSSNSNANAGGAVGSSVGEGDLERGHSASMSMSVTHSQSDFASGAASPTVGAQSQSAGFPSRPSNVGRPPAAGAAAAPRAAASADEDEGPTEEQLENLRRKFFHLASVAKSVVFARAQPAMKKKMVTEIQARVPSAVTLAIGDGANDTDMITAAHIGVGIAGVEGTAATNSADYAVGTFRMLHTLLFVHGYWSYRRIASLVNMIFYKASLVAILQFIFGFYSGFSGQQFFNDPLYQLYNVMMTALPIISVSVLDKSLPRNTLEDNPAAFREQKHRVFNASVFATWIMRALAHSIAIYFIPLAAFGEGVMQANDGRVTGLWYFSTTVLFCAVLLPTFFIFFLMYSINLFHVLAVLLSLLALYIVPIILNSDEFYRLNPNLHGIMYLQFASPRYWLTIILSITIPVMFEIALRALLRHLRPSFTELLQEKLFTARMDEHTLQHKLKHVPLPTDADPDAVPGAAAAATGARAGANHRVSNDDPAAYGAAAAAARAGAGASEVRRDGDTVVVEMEMSSLSNHPAHSNLGPYSGLSSGGVVSVSSSAAARRARGATLLPRPRISPEEEERWADITGGAAKANAKTQEALARLQAEAERAAVEAGGMDGAGSGKKSKSKGKGKKGGDDGEVEEKESDEEKLRSALVRAMLRFRNQTGAQFDSAAQTKYTKTDDLIAPAPASAAAAAAAGDSGAAGVPVATRPVPAMAVGEEIDGEAYTMV